MSYRSAVLGIFGAALICGLCFFNDRILRQTYLVGNYMPVIVYGMLFLFSAIVNPLLRRFRLSAGELSVIMAITLVPCCLPSSGLLRTFAPSLLLPSHYVKTRPAWRSHDILSLFPKRMRPDIETDEERVLGGFVQGLSQGDQRTPVSEIPWSAWRGPVMFWMPIVLCFLFACLSLSLIFHRQWCMNEHLQYPISSYADSFFPKDGGSVLKQKWFWAGMGFILLMYINNYLYQWFPQYLIPVRLRLQLWQFRKIFPTIVKGGGSGLFGPQLYFTVIGISYLIPSDISLAFGIGPWLWTWLSGILLKYGINMNRMIEGGNAYIALRPRMFMLTGSNMGLFMVMLYTGRRFYRKVAETLLGRNNEEAGVTCTWAARLFLLFIMLFIMQLVFMVGIDWQLAVIYTFLLVIFQVVMSRIVCESGLFHLQVSLFPCVVIWGLLGSASLGPEMLLLMQLVSMVLTLDPRESMMPFAMNSLKLVEKHRQPTGRTMFLAGVALIVGLAIATPVSLYFQYDRGFAASDSWANNSVPIMLLDNGAAVKSKLISQGTLEKAMSVSGWGRFMDVKPTSACTWSLVAGFVLVLLVYAAKLKYTWWPLSPLLLVTWNTSHLHAFAGSFIIGWCIKSIIVKYGGNKAYNRIKPFMIGCITGEIMGAVFPGIFAFFYYFATGEAPKAFRVLLT